jgi:hypothetical protein
VKSGVVEESRWSVDGESGCMLPMGVAAPYRVSLRSAAAVDRLTGAVEPHQTACLEFAPNAGWWGVFEVSDPVWEARVKSALRLLADSGFGGERSQGWGRAAEPSFSEASHLFSQTGVTGKWWLLSLYSPHENDAVDWMTSDYSFSVRGGWIDSPSGAGAKRQVRMIGEGSVLSAEKLLGKAVDVAPPGFAHPVYRSGVALTAAVPDEIVIRAVVEQAKPQKAAAVPVPQTPAAEPEVKEPTPAVPVEAPAPEPNPKSNRSSRSVPSLRRSPGSPKPTSCPKPTSYRSRSLCRCPTWWKNPPTSKTHPSR